MAVESAGSGVASQNFQILSEDSLNSPGTDVSKGPGAVDAGVHAELALRSQKALQAMNFVPEGMVWANARLGSNQDQKKPNSLGVPEIPMEKHRQSASFNRKIVRNYNRNSAAISAHVKANPASAWHTAAVSKLAKGMEVVSSKVDLHGSYLVSAASALVGIGK